MNVLFITADQWRGDALSAIGHPSVRTPSLDRVARDGVLFRRHYSQATPCAPGRASLYTGLYMHHHRVVANGTPLDRRHTNIALEARKLGYDPALFGYTDTSPDPRTCAPGDVALRRTDGVLPGMSPVVWMDDDMTPWCAHLRSKGYRIPPGWLGMLTPEPDATPGEGHGPTFAPSRFSYADSSTAFLVDRAIEHVSHPPSSPWFVHLSFLSPHPPFIAPAPYHAMYPAREIALPHRAASPEAEADQHPFLRHYVFNQLGWGLFVGHDSKNNLRLNDDEIRQARATYYGMISEVDYHLGRLFDHLRETGAYSRTLIVFTSDHGEGLGDHWCWAKYTYHDETFHVPLIVKAPVAVANRHGEQISRFTENIDVMPTILECLGAETPMECDGESLLPFLRGEPVVGWRDAAHYELDFRSFSGGDEPILGLKPDQCALSVLRDERYKYVHFTALPSLFFDLQSDPHELHDRAGDPRYRAVVLEYAQKMLSFRMNHDERHLANTLLGEEGPVQRRSSRR